MLAAGAGRDARMKLRNRTLVFALGFAAAWVVRLWLATLRYKIVCPDGVVPPPNPRSRRLIYAFWHESLLAPAFSRTKVSTLISQHADGELIAQACRGLGFGVIRGSTTRGGGPALLEMLRAAKVGHLMVTPDGPRGPRRRVQRGLIYVASQTGLPIVPAGVGFSHAWRARSWDRFAVPRPWSTVYVVLSEPIAVPAGLTRTELEQHRQRIEAFFRRLTDAAEQWAAGGKRPSPPPCINPVAVRLSA